MGMRVHVQNGCGDGFDEKRPEFMPHMDAVIPQVRFANESFTKTDSGSPADGKSSVVVRVYVMYE